MWTSVQLPEGLQRGHSQGDTACGRQQPHLTITVSGRAACAGRAVGGVTPSPALFHGLAPPGEDGASACEIRLPRGPPLPRPLRLLHPPRRGPTHGARRGGPGGLVPLLEAAL